MAVHTEAAAKYGQSNYNFEWQSDSPSVIQQKIQSETATLASQINKEKARLAILLMSYRQQMKKSRQYQNYDFDREEDKMQFNKIDCINKELIQKLKEHMARKYELGACQIVS